MENGPFMVYLLKMVIFHGYVSHNQMVKFVCCPCKIVVLQSWTKPSPHSQTLFENVGRNAPVATPGTPSGWHAGSVHISNSESLEWPSQESSLAAQVGSFPSHIFPHLPTSSRDSVENSWDPIPVILVSVIQSVNFLPWPAIADCRPLRAVQHWTRWTRWTPAVDGRARANFRWCCVEAPGHVRCCF